MLAGLVQCGLSRRKDGGIAGAIDGHAEANRFDGLKILIVEDDADSSDLLFHLLTSSGATCTAAGSGNEAFHAFVRQRPDILIADVWMADGNGFELIRQIRSLTPEQGGLIPAIAVSGGANAQQALMEGYHLLVPKPIDPDLVVRVVGEFARVDSEAPSVETCWTVSSPSPGSVVMAFMGRVGAADIRAATATLLHCLAERPCRITVDLRRLTGFSPAGAALGQRAVWSRRHAIEHVRCVGGSVMARSAVSAACRLLGIGCTVESDASAPTL